ncbi:MAG: hypothetical protein JW940_32705 [Polyangiaceae bacterium]|nr:hypothetical protein [Polyangiaceae bacterium]
MIDVNGTRYHLVYGAADWLPTGEGRAGSPGQQVEWVESDATLRLGSRSHRAPSDPQPRLAPSDRRGAARDRFGNWYWIGPDESELLVLGTAMTGPAHFWSAADETARPAGCELFQPIAAPGPPERLLMRGLTVTAHHYLVVGLVAPKGLLVFDLHAGGPPTRLCWPATLPFAPFDLTSSQDGGVWILDPDNRIGWRLDRHFELQAYPVGQGHTTTEEERFFRAAQPHAAPSTDADPSVSFPRAPLLRLDEAVNPVAIEALPDGSLLVLDADTVQGQSFLLRYVPTVATPGDGGARWRLGCRQPLAIPRADASSELPLLAQDMAFCPDSAAPEGSASGVLYVALAQGGQTYAFCVPESPSEALQLARPFRFLPMHRFGGRALVAAGDRAYYDSRQRWVPLAEQPRPRFDPVATWVLPAGSETLPDAAEPTARVFDGKEPGCVWHRLLLDACIPVGTEVTVQSRAADRRDQLAEQPWHSEPLLVRRRNGSELPFASCPLAGPADRTGTWETLLQRAQGRYLQILVTLRGTGRATPRLHALRVYYPRFSYSQQYLPAVYRDDPLSASFLERFLANVEGSFTALEGKIASAEILFGPRTVPDQYLGWLAAWLGAALDPAWSAATQRQFLAQAPQIFRERGTARGVERALRLALDPCPEQALAKLGSSGATTTRKEAAAAPGFHVRVVEQFLTRRAPGVVFGDPSDASGPGLGVPALDWSPEQGAEPLHERFRGYLRERLASVAVLQARWGQELTGFDDVELRMPAVQPASADQAEDWQRFLDEGLGFTYAPVFDSDLPRYGALLRRRYRQAPLLNTAYGLIDDTALAALSEQEVQAKLWEPYLRASLPASGPMLKDWIQFASVVLPTRRCAYRFSVLVPVGLNTPHSAQATKRRRAQQVAELVKPAHTSFDVKLYWAMFRVGEARLGLESELGDGSQSENTVLGDTYVGEGHLAITPPWDASERFIIGREALGAVEPARKPTGSLR